MAQFELVMPKMGESVAEATIIKWLKQEGDTIEAEESVLEIATDKVDSEVPAPVEGKLVKRLFGENDVVQVGQIIAIIETATAENIIKTASNQVELNQVDTPIHPKIEVPVIETQILNTSIDVPRTSENGRFYSPLVRSIAKEEGVALQELEQIKGSGSDGRVTKNDLVFYLTERKNTKTINQSVSETPKNVSSQINAAPVTTASTKTTPNISIGANDEIIEMDRMRKLIADHMVMSKSNSPHVTSFVEVDVTNMVRWRDKIKDSFYKREKEKITFTPIFIEAIVKAIKDFPMINISVTADYKIIKKGDINIGMAAALPSGNLIVPVIKNADRLNLLGLTKAVNDLAGRARNNQLKPEEIQGGTYTLTNVGTFGNVLGTPIINQPQVAIMAAGAIIKKPAVIETPEGDFIGIRQKMFLSHSYDHRVVDGALGGSFVRRVADYLEAFDPNREI